MKSIGIFYFRRDLRLNDNYALRTLCRACDLIVPVFCLDPRQIQPKHNPFYSPASVKCMFESLVDLNKQIQTHSKQSELIILQGKPEVCICALVHTLCKTYQHCSVAWNEDNTPFSVQRDANLIHQLTHKHPTVQIVTNHDDVTIVPIRNIRTNTNTLYKVFTPFYRKAVSKGVKRMHTLPRTQFIDTSAIHSKQTSLRVDQLLQHKTFAHLTDVRSAVAGGRTEALQRLAPAYIVERCRKYNTERNHTWEEKTTRLSAYLKFGCVSFREAYHHIHNALHTNHPVACEALTRELFWNAFYGYVAYHFPDVLKGQLNAFPRSVQTKRRPRPAAEQTKKARRPLPHRNQEMIVPLRGTSASLWENRATQHVALTKWKEGLTGFPYVDAAMRQFKTTGWMHNRARMVVASFLVKDLRVDWRKGERHFAQHLVDYDPASNNGGWQWAASTGADAQPYHRIFNPWTQSFKFDPNGVYIKKYITELNTNRITATDLHHWYDAHIRHKYENDETVSTYPSPVVVHSTARVETLRRWKALKSHQQSGSFTV